MVYDCFIFFNELDLLEIRLNELDSVVDKFVIVEADRTFQNKPKPFIFEENKQRFEKFLDKIIHVKLTKYPLFLPVINPRTAWKMEFYQRNSIVKGLRNCRPDDIILISDVDEIPKKEVIRKFSLHGIDRIFGVKMDMFMYFFNHKLIFDGGSQMDRLESKNGIWHCMVALPYRLLHEAPNRLRKTVMRTVRRGAKYPIIPNGGWHFSYMGGFDKIVQKLESFSHTEYNLDQYKKKEVVEELIHSGKDIFGRDLEFKVVDRVENMPDYFSNPDVQERFSDYFLEYKPKP
ncbi:glycosyltransferase family 17 protein [Flavobacterium silvaticum]|uniref:N-acetylglucosaminyltransferase n=1 Tax=Flavobacterium silvaticum TaxID=1852020 RepID=A0A972FNC1_9FLAO|nr:N-acetylglucosaminyltransferase [Flavobacterium silvaticum]NMH29229.1 N-acetylglucosaminyltransferase [Flavobacterium silvaticum]